MKGYPKEEDTVIGSLVAEQAVHVKNLINDGFSKGAEITAESVS